MTDHPIIENMERYGIPDGSEDVCPTCPECGQEAENFYKTADGYIVGCENCITKVDAWEEKARLLFA